jgi:hypothetical protein
MLLSSQPALVNESSIIIDKETPPWLQDACSTTTGSSDTEDNPPNAAHSTRSTDDILDDDLQALDDDLQSKRRGDCIEAAKLYGLHFGEEAVQNSWFDFGEELLPWRDEANNAFSSASRDDVKVAFAEELGRIVAEKSCAAPVSGQESHIRFSGRVARSHSVFEEQDSDDENIEFCQECLLPIGNVRYEGSECPGAHFHGECAAQQRAASMRKKQEETLKAQRRGKMEMREAYCIGWNVEHIPRNDVAASKLVVRDIPQGMVCLVLDEETRSIQPASTLQPAAAINLEYLSIALQVRRREGHEPIFSLNPIGNAGISERQRMQEKVFMPDWIAGTSVGEVLFQADFLLKEFSMGEHDQPVIGMRSCLDIMDDKACTGREWFVVRNAEMRINDDKALMPYVIMGVEARGQVLGDNGLEDIQITRADHPLAQYADQFTKNFDLIAERKSAIYHLRELAKASVVAKYLLENKIELGESWFQLAEKWDMPCSLEVPQLWNQTLYADVNEDKEHTTTHSVYGGVNFGLHKFPMSDRAPVQVTARRVVPRAPMTSHARALGRGLARGLGPPGKLSQGTLSSVRSPLGLSSRQLSLKIARDEASPRMALSSGMLPLAIPHKKFEPPAISSIAKRSALPDMVKPSRAISPIKLVGALAAKPERGALMFGGAAASMPSDSPAGVISVARAPMPLGATVQQVCGAAFVPPAMSVSAVSAPRMSAGLVSAALAAPRLTASLAPPLFAAAALPIINGLSSMPALAPLKGVDLRLDNFDVSEARHISSQACVGSWNKPVDECVSIGDAFWPGLEEGQGIFTDDGRALLNSIFHPALSDRRAEGELFTPPDASPSYVQKLHALVKQEDSVRDKRRIDFRSSSFNMNNPGEHFPPSWAPKIMALRRQRSAFDTHSKNVLVPRTEFIECATDLIHTTLTASKPVFDHATEEQTRYRIYRIGTLELRTIQELHCAEVVEAVFSVQQRDRLPTSNFSGEAIPLQEKLIKSSEYVEHASGIEGKPSSFRHHYLVVETERGHKILTERLRDGTVTWEENPADLEERNAFAKALDICKCSPGMLVQDLRDYHGAEAESAIGSDSASPSLCKRYVRCAYTRLARSAARRRKEVPSWWKKMAQDGMGSTIRENKECSFVALPGTMLKKTG